MWTTTTIPDRQADSGRHLPGTSKALGVRDQSDLTGRCIRDTPTVAKMATRCEKSLQCARGQLGPAEGPRGLSLARTHALHRVHVGNINKGTLAKAASCFLQKFL